MKSLDDEVEGAGDDVRPALVGDPKPAALGAAPAVATPRSPGRPRRGFRVRLGAVVSSILVALVVGIVHLAIDASQNTANENAAIAKLNPTSHYNAPLSSAVDERRAEAAKATTILNQASYLVRTPDYFTLSSALVDMDTDISEYDGDLLGKVTKKQYDTAIATLAKSAAALETARAALSTDMLKTPPPTPAATPGG